MSYDAASQEAEEVIADLKFKIANTKEHNYTRFFVTTAFAQRIVDAMERACI